MPDNQIDTAALMRAAADVQRQNRRPVAGVGPAWTANPLPQIHVQEAVNVNQPLDDIVEWARDDNFWFAQPVAAVGHSLKGPKISGGAEETATLQKLYNLQPIPEAARAIKTHGDANIFGVELEIEGWPQSIEDTEHTGFKFVSDGSLRNSGIEAIAHPNTSQGIVAITKSLWEKFGVNEKSFSERTSIHVHANVLNFTSDQLKVLMLAYATLEDLLFDFIGNDRYKNIFCVPWSEAGIGVGRLRDVLLTPRYWQKYTALNLCPIRTQGTVEFRHMEGHCDITRLQNWLTIIDDLLWYSRRCSFSEAMEKIQNLNTNSEYHAWASSVLKNSIHLFTYQQVRTKLARGVIEAKLLSV